ncbi:MAG: SufE family protein [Thermoleophilia bacterium]|nr:SufE family protein [Thermoleophilia bacterium]
MTDAVVNDLPVALTEIATEFHELAIPDRLQLLLEFSKELPALPERYTEHPELLEPVPECQSPIFLITEVDGGGPGAAVRLTAIFSIMHLSWGAGSFAGFARFGSPLPALRQVFGTVAGRLRT